MNPSKMPALNLIVSGSVMSNSGTPWTVACWLFCRWDSPGQNTGVGSHSLLQGIFRTQGLKPGLLHCRQILYHLNYQGSHLSCMLNHLKVKVKVAPSCPTLCDHLWNSPGQNPGVHGVLINITARPPMLYSIIPQVTVTPSKILMSLIQKQLGNRIF